jgi:homoserine O-acetyltransferase
VEAATTIIGIDSDRLYPPRLQHELARLLPGTPPVHLLSSPYGHDAFLIESERIGAHIAQALAEPGGG